MRVFITGVTGSVGRLLARRLLDDPAVESVIGLDGRACFPPVPGLHFVRADLRQPEWMPLLDQVDVALHLAGMGWPARRSQRNAATRVIEGSKSFLRAAQAAAVPKVIVANSAALYGVQPAGPVLESAPVYGHQAGSYARARALVSDYLDLLTDAFPVLTRLRVAWVCGPLHLGLVRYFTSNPVLVCGYEDRGLQVVHESDLIAAFMLAIQHDLPGVYNVGSPDKLTFRDLAALVGQNRACVPLAWQTLRAWVAWRWLERRTPPVWVRLLYRGFPVDPGKLSAAGWVTQHTPRAAMIEALNVYQAGV